MKIAIFGLNFPLGKRPLEDERIKTLVSLLRSPNAVHITVELQDSSHLKDADAILLKEDLKQDLILMDLDKLDNSISRTDLAVEFIKKLKNILEKETLLNEVSFNLDEEKIILSLNLLTYKPLSFISQDDEELLKEKIKELYYKSKRICFFTANEKQLRAWEIRQGTTAYQASGLIHSDIQRGFIKAEVIGYDTLIQAGGLSQVKAKGLVRLEDKDYIIQDGDLIYFRFNV